MRRMIGALVLNVLLLGLPGISGASSRPLAPENGAIIYDPSPSHLWNRLHSALFIRTEIGRAHV